MKEEGGRRGEEKSGRDKMKIKRKKKRKDETENVLLVIKIWCITSIFLPQNVDGLIYNAHQTQLEGFGHNGTKV